MDPQEKTLKVAFIAFPSCLVAIGLSELFNIIPRDTRETVRSHCNEYLGPYVGETAISPEIEAERSTPYHCDFVRIRVARTLWCTIENLVPRFWRKEI